MNALKSLLAVAVLACSVNVSAQIVFTPDFPVKKDVESVNADHKSIPAVKTVAQEAPAVKKAA